MDYPLGSFPRFGYQERWARERRARAIANSAITRRNNAAYYLNVEKAFFNWLIQLANSMTPRNEEGVKTIAAIQNKLSRIRAKLEGGNRVYFKCLGRIFHTIAVSSNTFSDIHNLDEKTLASVAENIGRDELFKLR